MSIEIFAICGAWLCCFGAIISPTISNNGIWLFTLIAGITTFCLV